MIAVARFIRDHRRSVARTLRETFGVGLSNLGDGLTWGEADDLLQEAAADPSTTLGADLAGWAYPASIPDLLNLIATVGKPDASRAVMPWVMANPRHPEVSAASADEVAAAQAELERDLVFS